MHTHDGTHAALHGAQSHVPYPGGVLVVGLGVGHGQGIVVELGGVLVILAIMHVGEGNIFIGALGHQGGREDDPRLFRPGDGGQRGGEVHDVLAAGAGQGMDALVPAAVGLEEDFRALLLDKCAIHQRLQSGDIRALGGVAGQILLRPAVNQVVVANVVQVQAVDGVIAAQLPGDVRHVGQVALVRKGNQPLVAALGVMIAAALGMLLLVARIAGGGEPGMHADAGLVSRLQQLAQEVTLAVHGGQVAAAAHRAAQALGEEVDIRHAHAPAAGNHGFRTVFPHRFGPHPDAEDRHDFPP